MAMFVPAVTGEKRGSEGGSTFTRDRGGMLFRARIGRAVGVTNSTLIARQVFKAAVAAWNNKSTGIVQADWNSAVSIWNQENKSNLSGFGWFVQYNCKLMMTTFPNIDYGKMIVEIPTQIQLQPPIEILPDSVIVNNIGLLDIDGLLRGNTTGGGTVVAFITKAQPPGRNPMNGKFSCAGSVNAGFPTGPNWELGFGINIYNFTSYKTGDQVAVRMFYETNLLLSQESTAIVTVQ